MLTAFTTSVKTDGMLRMKYLQLREPYLLSTTNPNINRSYPQYGGPYGEIGNSETNSDLSH